MVGLEQVAVNVTSGIALRDPKLPNTMSAKTSLSALYDLFDPEGS